VQWSLFHTYLGILLGKNINNLLNSINTLYGKQFWRMCMKMRRLQAQLQLFCMLPLASLISSDLYSEPMETFTHVWIRQKWMFSLARVGETRQPSVKGSTNAAPEEEYNWLLPGLSEQVCKWAVAKKKKQPQVSCWLVS